MLPFHRRRSRCRCKKQDRQSQVGLVELSINIRKNQATNLPGEKLRTALLQLLFLFYWLKKGKPIIQYNAFTNVFWSVRNAARNSWICPCPVSAFKHLEKNVFLQFKIEIAWQVWQEFTSMKKEANEKYHTSLTNLMNGHSTFLERFPVTVTMLHPITQLCKRPPPA